MMPGIANENLPDGWAVINRIRSALIDHARRRLEPVLGEGLDSEVQDLFKKEWSAMQDNAEVTARTLPVPMTFRDALDYVDISHCRPLYEKFWKVLIGSDEMSPGVRARARQTLLDNMSAIVARRNALAHPLGETVDPLLRLQLLISAHTVAQILELPEIEWFETEVRRFTGEANGVQHEEGSKLTPRVRADSSAETTRSRLADFLDLDWPPPAVGELDLSEVFNLASPLTGGHIPPYVTRTADVFLGEAFRRAASDDAHSLDRLVVVSGPKKSGITRSVVELLREFVPKYRILIPMPATQSGSGAGGFERSPLLLSIADGFDQDEIIGIRHLESVLLIDGFDSYWREASGRNVQLLLRRILDQPSRPIVVLLVDSYFLDAPDAEYRDLGISVTQRDFVSGQAIRYSDQFDLDEQSRCLATFDPSWLYPMVPASAFEHLPEHLGALPALESRLTEVLRDPKSGLFQSIWLASLDALIFCPDGAGAEDLRQLTALRYADLVPGSSGLNEDQWTSAFTWAVSPVGPSAALIERSRHLVEDLWQVREGTTGIAAKHLPDHQISDRTLGWIDERQFELLLDLVRSYEYWERLRALAEYGFQRGFPCGTYYCGVVAELVDVDINAALSWYEQAISAGFSRAYFDLGGLFARSGQHDLKTEALRLGLEGGDIRCKAGLCWGLEGVGQSAEADLVWDSLPEGGDAQSIRELGLSLSHRGQRDRAEVWLRRASDLGDTDGQYFLARILVERGDVDEAEYRLRQTPYGEGATDMTTCALARLLWKNGEIREAARLFEEAAEGGNELAIIQLGMMMFERGDHQQCLDWLSSNADVDPWVEVFLGKAFELLGRTSMAVRHYRRSLRADPVVGAYSLAELQASKGDIDVAMQLYLRSAKAGVAPAMRALAAILDIRGMGDSARAWRRQADELGVPSTAWLLHHDDQNAALLAEFSNSGPSQLDGVGRDAG